MYPPLLQVAEVCLSMPVSNAWPERGASALKRLKTRLRNLLKKQMLESLLHITINGPPVQESEFLITKAVALWKEKNHRRKLPRSSPSSAEETGHAKFRTGAGGKKTEELEKASSEEEKEDEIEKVEILNQAKGLATSSHLTHKCNEGF